MKYQSLIAITLFSTILVGCNDDIAANRKERINQEAASETIIVVSGIHRNRGTTPLSYNAENSIYSEGTTIHRVPDMTLHDDGVDKKNVTFATRPTVPCGLASLKTLSSKIADCALTGKNGDAATWNGTLNAGSAEGIWQLVTFSSDPDGTYEIWLDKKTGMLWSDVIKKTENWCAASGNSDAVSDIIGISCTDAGVGSNFCGLLLYPELKSVNWRLPTRNDYLQADLDGIRFVVKRGTDANWTATISTSTDTVIRTKAWTYNMTYGTLVADLVTANHHVRCIGTSNFK